MSRWPPDTSSRLKRVAIALFAERGFATVTAAEVAAGAGMTERTFFRHFKAKEEVLFEDHAALKAALIEAIAAAPAKMGARGLMRLVAEFLSARFEPQRAMHRTLHAVISSDATLRMRALQRDREWAAAVAAGFARRGYATQRAATIAAVTTAAFGLVYLAWLSDTAPETLAQRFAAVELDFAQALAE